MCNGLRFPKCIKLTVTGSVLTTAAILKTIDPEHLKALKHLILSVADAEEENAAMQGERVSSHLQSVLAWLTRVGSLDLTTVRINFVRVHLAHIISAFSAPQGAQDGAAGLGEFVFSKARRLFQIQTKLLVMPMQFLDDLDLTSCAFLARHFEVTHSLSVKKGNKQVHYLVKRRQRATQAHRDWSLSLAATEQVTFDFAEEF